VRLAFRTSTRLTLFCHDRSHKCTVTVEESAKWDYEDVMMATKQQRDPRPMLKYDDCFTGDPTLSEIITWVDEVLPSACLCVFLLVCLFVTPVCMSARITSRPNFTTFEYMLPAAVSSDDSATCYVQLRCVYDVTF